MDEQTWTQQTPFGPIRVSAGTRGVRAVEFTTRQARKPRRRRLRARRDDAVDARFRKIAESFDRYFDGEAHALDAIEADLTELSSAFDHSVLMTLRELVAPGETISYGELAAAVGHPGAARAVGSAMANNPVPIIIPCHRVVAADGTLGGYGGGLGMKAELLRMEGAQLSKTKSPGLKGGRRPRR